MAEHRMLLDGAAPTLDNLQDLALHNYGHYTSFIAQTGAVRGWSLHLERLRFDARALLGIELDLLSLRAQLRQCLRGFSATTQSVRITVYPRDLSLRQLGGTLDARILINAEDWNFPTSPTLDLHTVVGLREAPQHKHIGLCAALLARRQAQLLGADDALLLDSGGHVAEGPSWNLGVYDGGRLLWPNAPALPGITRQLLSKAFADRGLPSVNIALGVADLHRARTVFACNSRQPLIPVASIDGQALGRDPSFEALLCDTWQALEWELI